MIDTVAVPPAPAGMPTSTRGPSRTGAADATETGGTFAALVAVLAAMLHDPAPAVPGETAPGAPEQAPGLPTPVPGPATPVPGPAAAVPGSATPVPAPPSPTAPGVAVPAAISAPQPPPGDGEAATAAAPPVSAVRALPAAPAGPADAAVPAGGGRAPGAATPAVPATTAAPATTATAGARDGGEPLLAGTPAADRTTHEHATPPAPAAAATAPPAAGPAVPGGPRIAVPAAPAGAPAAPPPPAPHLQLAAVVAPLRREGDGAYRLRLHLQPEDLGALDVDVEVRAGQVHLRLHAEEAATVTALRHAMPELRAELEAAGFRAGAFDVTARGDGQPGGHAADHRGPSARPAPAGAPLPHDPDTIAPSHDGALDVRL